MIGQAQHPRHPVNGSVSWRKPMPAFYEIRWLPNGPTEEYAGSRGIYYEFFES